MFQCPNCSTPTKRLVIPEDHSVLGCYSCVKSHRRTNVNLGQVLEKWTHVTGKGQGDEKKHRLTVGKAWELDNRQISRDDPTKVINRATGKETQY